MSECREDKMAELEEVKKEKAPEAENVEPVELLVVLRLRSRRR